MITGGDDNTGIDATGWIMVLGEGTDNNINSVGITAGASIEDVGTDLDSEDRDTDDVVGGMALSGEEVKAVHKMLNIF
jgi:hypothetical protein